MSGNYDCRIIKTVILGDQNVGKTALVQRASTGDFEDQIKSTVGATYTTMTVNHLEGTVKLHVWDTAGQENFRSLVPIYFRDAVCALVVFDLTQIESFRNLDYWVTTLRTSSPRTVVGIIGNKVDLADNRVVPLEEVQEFMNMAKVAFYEETSAVTGQGVHGLFTRLFDCLTEFERQESSPTLDEPLSLALNHEGRPQDQGCC
jgi:Ras-related protein Rab-6A